MQGKVWRAGANEATIFEINKDVKVEGKTLAAGKYALFMLPAENEWTVIFNKNGIVGAPRMINIKTRMFYK